MSFLELLFFAGVIDAHTLAHQYRGLLRTGQFFAVLGGIFIVGRLIVGNSEAGQFLILGAVLSFIVAALLLFLFAMAAKLYGQVGAAFVLLFIGSCFGLVMLGSGPSQPRAELGERSLRNKPLVAESSGRTMTTEHSAAVTSSGVVSPSRARETSTSSQPAKTFVTQVYAVSATRLYYAEECARPKAAFRIPKATALREGYVAAPECSPK